MHYGHNKLSSRILIKIPLAGKVIQKNDLSMAPEVQTLLLNSFAVKYCIGQGILKGEVSLYH
jgi:hypothetical protein